MGLLEKVNLFFRLRKKERSMTIHGWACVVKGQVVTVSVVDAVGHPIHTLSMSRDRWKDWFDANYEPLEESPQTKENGPTDWGSGQDAD
jgi:hypothetical protein